MSFQVPFFGEIIPRQGVRPDPRKLKALRYATIKIKDGITGIPQHNKLFKHIFSSDR